MRLLAATLILSLGPTAGRSHAQGGIELFNEQGVGQDRPGSSVTSETASLASGRTRTVFSRGDPFARIAFVGEGPGADEMPEEPQTEAS